MECASINWFPVEKISKVVSRYCCADSIKHLVVWAISMFSFAPCRMVTQVYWILTGITRYVPPKRCTLAFTGHYVSGWHVHCTHWFIRTVLCDDWKNDWQTQSNTIVMFDSTLYKDIYHIETTAKTMICEGKKQWLSTTHYHSHAVSPAPYQDVVLCQQLHHTVGIYMPKFLTPPDSGLVTSSLVARVWRSFCHNVCLSLHWQCSSVYSRCLDDGVGSRDFLLARGFKQQAVGCCQSM